MYLNIISHNAKNYQSSSNVFLYLDKENQQEKLHHQNLISEGRADEINPNTVEHFFNQNFNPYDLNDVNSKIDVYQASEMIDKNRGSKSLSSSNFYMINVAPSEQELEHMKSIAVDELKNRGLNFDDCKYEPTALEFYNEQLDQLMKLQMKLYTNDLMDMYAKQMDREIYANQESLPSNAERKAMQPEVEKRYQEFLEEQGLKEKVGNSYSIINFEKKLYTNIEGASTYIINHQGEEMAIFVPKDKVKEINSNSVAIQKEYLNDRLKEEKDKQEGIYTDEKIKIQVSIDKEVGNSTQISVKPKVYNGEVKLWVNNKDFSKLQDGTIEMNKYRAEKLINSAVERDKEQKQLVEINFKDISINDIKGQDDRMIVFQQEIKGLNEPIKVSFKESELKKEGNKYFVEKYKLDYRTDKAKSEGIKNEFGDKKEEIKNQVWKENGFDTTKRKVERKDLLYFAKVEKERTYKHTDKAVLKNRPILDKIEKYKNSVNPLDKLKIAKLEEQLLRDKHTGEVIKEGVKKGGMQYHCHIVVSRHDATSINPRDKVSMSPKANHKDGKMYGGAKVGFHRDNFFKAAEQIFDVKFEYDRPLEQKYSHLNQVSKSYRQKVGDRAKGELIGKLQGEIEKVTGVNEIKQELNPVAKAKKEIMPIPLPTSLPKSKIDLVIKVIKLLKNVSVDKGIQY